MIWATHRCFDDVTDWLNALAADGATREELMRYTVVHGIIAQAPDGKKIAHAWLELGSSVIQFGIYQGERICFDEPRAQFLERVKVFAETRYTLDEVLVLDRTVGRPPWRQEYKELCADWRLER